MQENYITDREEKNIQTFSFISIFLLAPEKGLFSNRNIGHFLEIYIFLFFFFCLGTVCHFIFSTSLIVLIQVYNSLYTHWFVAVVLLTF